MMPIPDDPIISGMERNGVPPWFDSDYHYDEPDEDEEDEETEETALIEVRQLPIIAERLYQVKQQIEAMVQDATSLAVTEETVQTVKAKRAELRKTFDELEEQRKAVKTAVLGPYDEFEKVYRECISEPFKRADETMKSEIADLEDGLKKRCREELELYFAELCISEDIDFLTFDQAMALGKLKISLADAKSKSQKKLKDGLAEVVSNVAETARQIEGMDDGPEIFVEYKNSFDIGHAVSVVQNRKKRVEEERKAAQERAEAQKRREAVSPVPVVEQAPKAPEKVFERLTFTIINVTRSQAIRVREFLKQEGIQYE